MSNECAKHRQEGQLRCYNVSSLLGNFLGVASRMVLFTLFEACAIVSGDSCWEGAMANEASSGAPIEMRSYGQNDYHRFEAEALRGSHLSVGSKRLGKVDVDCKYRYQKTQVGVMGQDKKPAGIIYMDITFHQPHGYWLQSAVVYITIGEDDTSDTSYILAQSKTPKKHRTGRQRRADLAVQMTQHFGPRCLTGPETTRTEVKHNSFVPTVGIMGFEVGGMGRSSFSSQELKGHWTFKGSVVTPKGCLGLRTLQWEFTANKLEPDQNSPHDYRTAFAFEHSRNPLYMRVEIDGKLQSKVKNLCHNLAIFSSHLGRKDSSTVTRMHLSHKKVPHKELDEIAEGLEKAMQMENLERTPVKIPGSAIATFSEHVHTNAAPSLANKPRIKQDPLLAALRAETENTMGKKDGLAQQLWLATTNLGVEGKPAQLAAGAANAMDNNNLDSIARPPTSSPVITTTESTRRTTTTAGPREHREITYKHPDGEVSNMLESTTVLTMLKLLFRINVAFWDASHVLYLLFARIVVTFSITIPQAVNRFIEASRRSQATHTHAKSRNKTPTSNGSTREANRTPYTSRLAERRLKTQSSDSYRGWISE
ncbi:hypothetical protein PspLS_01660 [Pyricularia sp. CBS 133598]|nr:hypothetical protein PspLS_01660 [Pyricularia sp. CBS 133598]